MLLQMSGLEEIWSSSRSDQMCVDLPHVPHGSTESSPDMAPDMAICQGQQSLRVAGRTGGFCRTGSS